MRTLSAVGVDIGSTPVTTTRARPMAMLARALCTIAALVVLLAFFFPLWRYDLEAPQYPEGISMTIWLGRLGGRLDLVNGLNHYIGMRRIEPESFPELTVMPWIVGALSLGGFLVALAGRVWLLDAWVGLFGLFGVAGVADFYRWLYEFGHTLSPAAPIYVDPFTPPLVGPKLVMNFRVLTYPDVGGAAIMLALLLGVAAVALEWCRRGRAVG